MSRSLRHELGYMRRRGPRRRDRNGLLGRRRVSGRRHDRLPAGVSGAEFRVAQGYGNFGRLRPLHTSAVIFAFGGNALICHLVLRRPAHQRRAALGRQPGLVRVLGLSAVHRAGGDRLSAGRHPVQGICRTGMVCRPLADHRLGRLSRGFPGHDHQAERAAYLRGELVLPVVHRHRRDAACGQQPVDPGLDLRLANRCRSSPACRMR